MSSSHDGGSGDPPAPPNDHETTPTLPPSFTAALQQQQQQQQQQQHPPASPLHPNPPLPELVIRPPMALPPHLRPPMASYQRQGSSVSDDSPPTTPPAPAETVLLDGPPVISRSMSKRGLLVGGERGHKPVLSSSLSRLHGGLDGSLSASALGPSNSSAAAVPPPLLPASSAHQQQLHQHVIAQAHLTKRPSIYFHHPVERRGSGAAAGSQKQSRTGAGAGGHHNRVWSDSSERSAGGGQQKPPQHGRRSTASSLGDQSYLDENEEEAEAARPWWKFWGPAAPRPGEGAAPAPPLAAARTSLDDTLGGRPFGFARNASNASLASLQRVPRMQGHPPSSLSAGGSTAAAAAPSTTAGKGGSKNASFFPTSLVRRWAGTTAASAQGPSAAGSSTHDGLSLSSSAASAEQKKHEEAIMADEIVNNIEHAKKAMAYQAEFIRSFGMSSQLFQFLQINATILSFDVHWPPALERLFKFLRLFLFDFRLFHFKYTALVVSACLPLVCYYLSEVFWFNSARWRAQYINNWPQERAVAWRRCTLVIIVTGLVCAAVVSFGELPALDAFGVTWVVTCGTLLLYAGFVGLGDLMRKLYVILEHEEERMSFFLQIRYWLRYLVLVVLNLAYLPILGKLFKIIYKAKHYHEEGHHVAPAPWITATVLAALYGVGLPIVISMRISRRRRLFEWVPDPTDHDEGGRFEVKAAVVADNKGTAGGGKLEEDDDLLSYNYLELEQQVHNLRSYAASMPLIQDLSKRTAVRGRVKSSLRRKQAAAVQSRRQCEDVYELEKGSPMDDYWKPLKARFFLWKVWGYYVERGLLVGLVVTQDGQKVAKSLSSIVASFVIIGGTALALLLCQPYHKRKENFLETFFDMCSTFNIVMALALCQHWLDVERESFVAYIILVPNLLVLCVAIYIMDPRALWRALRFKYQQFQARTREHWQREKDLADRESRALFVASFKGDVQRVKDLLAQGRADVRYEKPKDVKPIGFAGYTPTQIAVYMGKAECLELLLAHHTLFAEEEIVKRSKVLARFGLWVRYLARKVSTVASYVAAPTTLLPAGRKGRLWHKQASSTKAQLLVTPTTSMEEEDEAAPNAMAAAAPLPPVPVVAKKLLDVPLPPPAAPPAFSQDGSLIRYHHHDLTATGQHKSSSLAPPSSPSGSNNSKPPSIHHRLLARQQEKMAQQQPDSAGHPHPHHHSKWSAHADSMAMDGADHAILRCTAPATAGGAGKAASGGGGEGTDKQEFVSLVGLAFCSWSRDCLDLLLTYGSEVYDDETLLHHQHHLDNAAVVPAGPPGSSSQRPQASLIAMLRRRLYQEVADSPMDVKLRLTAAAALHHPRDLQWVLDPDRGNVMEDEHGHTDAFGFLIHVFRKIKHDHKSTKDMKVLAIKSLVEEVVARRLMGNETLRLDLSYMGIDDHYLEHILHSLWDITATGVPTNLLLEGNALTDYGIRSLVLKLRENMPASVAAAMAAAAGALAADGGATGLQSPLAGSNLGGSGPLSPLSAAGSHHTAVGGSLAHPHITSIVALNLTGNDVGTDGALFLADLVTDYHAALRSVTVFKVECTVLSPRSLALDRVVDRSLSLESALVLAIIVDAYGGVRDEAAAAEAAAALLEQGGGGVVEEDDGGLGLQLHSGGHVLAPAPVAESAVKQVLAMGEKEGWKKRLVGGEREFR